MGGVPPPFNWALGVHMKTYLKLFTLLLFSSLAYGAEFKPYSDAKISLKKFEKYQTIIVSEFGNSVIQVPDQNLVVYLDNSKGNYAFTTANHAAHPAWIARRVIEKNGSIDIEQIGYFAGKEKPFTILFQQYFELNEKIKKRISN